LNIPEGKQTLEQLIGRLLWQLLHDSNPAIAEADIQRLERLIDMGYQLNLGLSLARAQELYFRCLNKIVPWCLQAIQTQQGDDNGTDNSTANNWNIAQLRDLLRLGQKLGVDVSVLLNELA
jgi:hypothetical protein